MIQQRGFGREPVAPHQLFDQHPAVGAAVHDVSFAGNLADPSVVAHPIPLRSRHDGTCALPEPDAQRALAAPSSQRDRIAVGEERARSAVE